MTRPTRHQSVLALASLLTLGVLVAWLVGRDTTGGPTGVIDGRSDRSVGAPSRFTIGADASRPIRPGLLVELDLSLDNPNDLPLTIDAITVTLIGIDAPRADVDHPCGAADFEIRQLGDSVELRLAGNSADTLSGLGLTSDNWPAVGMIDRPVNQDGCKGASLALDYQAVGEKVRE